MLSSPLLNMMFMWILFKLTFLKFENKCIVDKNIIVELQVVDNEDNNMDSAPESRSSLTIIQGLYVDKSEGETYDEVIHVSLSTAQVKDIATTNCCMQPLRIKHMID